MPDIGIGAAVPRAQQRAIEALAELGGAGFGDVMRRDAAVRLLVLARRAPGLLPVGGAETAEAALVRRMARRWDARATTAAEFVEALPVTELDSFLRAARRWAAATAAGGTTGLDRVAA
jgi:hypothetical protein